MKKTILGVVLAGAILFSSTATFAQTVVKITDPGPVVFTDISKHWSNEAVQNLIKKGAIPFEQGKFNPAKAITRSEFAVMLHEALDIQIAYLIAPDIKDYFDDVKQDATYAMAVIDLVTANIFEGKGNFNPEATLTRDEMVHYLMNAHQHKMGDKYALIKINPASFKDVDKIKPEYSGAVARAEHYKLIAGVGMSLFNPQSKATRAEAASVVSKLMLLIEKQNPAVVIIPSIVAKEDSLEMKLTITNNSDNAVTFDHSSGQKFDFVLLDAKDKELYRWSEGKVFTMMLTSSVIEAGKSIEYSAILDGDQFKAIKDKIVTLKAFALGSSDFFSIKTEGYELKLK